MAEDSSTSMRDDTTAECETPGRADDLTTSTNATAPSDGDESLLDEAELTGSTPRPPATKTIQARLSKLESPYETMKREMRREQDGTTALEGDDSTILMAQYTARLPDMSMTPRAEGDRPLAALSTQKSKDPLLHRVLDKNYRLQATPHKTAFQISPLKGNKEAEGETRKGGRLAWQDSPMSSPEMAVPTLRSEAFMSPFKSKVRQRAALQGPRTPGVSVQTPATGRKTRDALAPSQAGRAPEADRWSDDGFDDDDVDLYAGMSPPKTIQFALPASKILQTPGECLGKNRSLFYV